MDPFSGILDLFEKKGIITQQGNRLKYVDSKGKEHLEYRKQWKSELLSMVMNDYILIQPEKTVEESVDEEMVVLEQTEENTE